MTGRTKKGENKAMKPQGTLTALRHFHVGGVQVVQAGKSYERETLAQSLVSALVLVNIVKE